MMEKDQNHVTNRILQLTLDIIYLLTGENYGPLKRSREEVPVIHDCQLRESEEQSKSQKLILNPPARSPIPDRDHKKILEVINEIIELLRAEETECVEGQKNPYRGTMMEEEPPLTSPDGSRKRNPPERCTRPLFSQGSAQEEQMMSQSCQVGDMMVIKVEAEDEAYVRVSEQCAEDEISPQICTDGRYARYRMQNSPIEDDDDVIVGSSGEAADALNIHSGLHQVSDFFIHLAPRGGRTFTFSRGREDFTQTSRLFSHLTSRTGETAFPGSLFSAKRSILSQQERIRNKKSPFSCLKCNRRFICRSYLLAHQKVHAREKRYSHERWRCFKTKSSLGQQDDEEQPVSCQECGKYCRQKWDLLRHLRCHTGEKPFSCSICGRCFSQEGGLIDHQRSHADEKPYSCQECGKRFKYRSNLVIHKRLHTGEQSYVGSNCGQGFTNKAHLVKRHVTHCGSKSYSCPKCGNCFVLKSDFVRHQLSHKGEEGKFSWIEYGKFYKSKLHLAKHQNVHNQEKPYSCLRCGQGFSEKMDHIKHQAECGRSLMQNNLFIPSGERTFSWLERDKRHLQVATHPEGERSLAGQLKRPKEEEEKSFSCLECGERFAEVLALVEHHKIHTRPQTDQGVFCCSECGKCFSHQTSLDGHLKIHKEEKPFPCSECGQYFVDMSSLVVHQKIHTVKRDQPKVTKRSNKVALPCSGSEHTSQTSQEREEKPHLCSECGQCFVRKSALFKHQKTHKTKKAESKVFKHQLAQRSKPAFCCQQCGAAFGCQYSLDDHLRKHADDETSYVCPECGLCFMGMSSLQQHQKTHIGEKPRSYYKRRKQTAQSQLFPPQDESELLTFSCEDCGKCFNNKSSLRKHYRTHTGEKPFPCLECGKSFSQSSSLAVHRRRHRGEKNYSCLECGKSFIRKADVDRHLISHTGERNFTCAQCGKCYAQLSALIAHRKVHAGVMPHSCSDCGKCFTERWMLVRHEKTHTRKFAL